MIALDPEYATAYARQAFTLGRGFTHHWGEPRGRAAAAAAMELARRAVEIEPDSPLCLSRLAFILLLNSCWPGGWLTALLCYRTARRSPPEGYTNGGDR